MKNQEKKVEQQTKKKTKEKRIQEGQRYLDLNLRISEVVEIQDPKNYSHVHYDQASLGSFFTTNDVLELNKSGVPLLPVIVSTPKSLGAYGISVSQELAKNTGLKKDDLLKFRKLQNVPLVNSLECTRIRSTTETKSTTETEKAEETAPFPEQKKKQFMEYLRSKFAYNYLITPYQFEYQENSYRLCIKDFTKPYGQITPNTNLILELDLNPSSIEKRKSIIGLEDAYQSIREIMQWGANYKEEFKRLGIETPKGILLHGLPGTGKTHLVRELARASNWAFYKVSGPEIMSKFIGNSEKHLRQIFETAKKNQPAIIFFDEIDSIGQSRSNSSQVESRIVSQLLTCMDGLASRGEVLVIAATNYPNKLDPALRRPDRLDREVKIKAPNLRDRIRLLAYFIKKKELLSPEIDLKELAKRTSGYVQADLKYLVNEAKLNIIRRKRALQSVKDLEHFEEKLTKEDFDQILKEMTPSSLRDQKILKPETKFSDVIGYEKVKNILLNEVYYPLKYPELFKQFNIKPIKGVLLEGPPGTGKTTLAKALASELDYNFMIVNGPQLLNKFVGSTEQNIRELFSKAREVSPCVVFFDEIDALFSQTSHDSPSSVNQNSKTGQFLTQIDGISKKDNLFLIGTTNKAELLDVAMTRSGRFEKTLTLGYPSVNELKKLYEYYFDSVCDLKDFSSILGVSHSNRMTGADVAALKRMVLIENLKKLSADELMRKELLCKLGYSVNLNIKIQDIQKTLGDFIKSKQQYYRNTLRKI